jgi:TonB-linked SusC/RagA family outer membrane protein
MISKYARHLVTGSALILLSHGILGQSGNVITGKILNSRNQPVKDVAVNYEGSEGSPVITDSTGQFIIEVPTGDEWLSISPLGGYLDKRVYLNRQNEIEIYVIEENSRSIYDEAIYLGKYSKEHDLTASLYTRGVEGKLRNTNESFDQGLQGRVPGLYQVGLSGMPGQGTYMLIRGTTSIHTNNQPLVIVDGMPLEVPGRVNSSVNGYQFHPLSSLDQMDISNITLIRDGSALTSFGVRGSNGIIYIETLKPEETNTSIDFAFKTGLHYFNKQIPQLNSQEYKTLAKEVLSSSPIPEEKFQDLYPGLYYTPSQLEYNRYSHITNWQDEIFRNAFMQDYYVAVKGGDAIAKYGLSVGYQNHLGTIDETKFNRFNTRFVGTFNIFNWLKIYASANLVSSNASYKESGLVSETSPIITSLHKTPQMNPLAFDEEGNYISELDDVDELGVSNPSAVIQNYKADNANYRFLTSFRVEGDITSNLRWISMLGLNIFDIKENVFMPNQGMELYFEDEAHNVSVSLNNLLFTIYNDNYLSYNKLINNIHRFGVVGGFRWNTNDYQEDLGYAMNSSENDQYTNLQSGDQQLRNIGGNNARWNWLSTYVNASYAFREKYILEAGLSSDFSSKTGKQATGVIRIGDAPFGTFYNIGAAWRISGESFLAGVNAIEDLKLRVSYGTTGNDDIGHLNALNYYKLKIYRETSGMVPGGIANEFLTFEKISQIGTGLDISLWGNRLKLTGDYYRSETRDMLIFEQLSSYIGYDVFPSNRASMDNSGYDFSLHSQMIRTNNFMFSMGLNLSHYSSTISSVPKGELITELPGGLSLINRVGEPANSFYGYQFEGVYKSSAEAMADGLVNAKGISFGAGDAKFKDMNGDDVINELDKVILGSPTPDLYGGLSTDFKYKRWGLDILWQFVYGNEVYNYIRYENEKMTDISNQSKAVLNRWVSEGQETSIPRSLWNDPIGNSSFSSRWIEDGSYLRLKVVTLSYEIPHTIGWFRNLQIFLTGTNLFTVSNYLSYDPEFSAGFLPDLQGVDYGLAPFGTKIMVGVKFGL